MLDKNKMLHAGHRGRMREKFSQYGRDVFHTHELLEMLLFHIIPYKNTNEIAKNLISRFGTLDGVFSASRQDLKSVAGVGPRVADMIFDIGRISLAPGEADGEKCNRRSFGDYKETGDFFVEYFAGRESSSVVIMLLNSKMELIDCVSLYDMDYESAGVKPEPFIDAAIAANASIAVVAHNHPYGPLFPTRGDVVTNKMISDSLSAVGVPMLEHYIVSGSGYLGFMTNLSTAFSQYSEIEKFIKSKAQEYEG